MDGVSAASSAFAVVSVALQLAESFKTLYDFFEAVHRGIQDKSRTILDEALTLLSTGRYPLQDKKSQATCLDTG